MLEGGVSDLLALVKKVNTAECTSSKASSGDIEGEGLIASPAGEITVSGDGITD
jgi:hypothetical protein